MNLEGKRDPAGECYATQSTFLVSDVFDIWRGRAATEIDVCAAGGRGDRDRGRRFPKHRRRGI